MKPLIAAVLFCFAILASGSANAQTITPLVDQTTPFVSPQTGGDVVYFTGDEIADRVVFSGTRRITRITIKYTSLTPIHYTVRFYRLPPPILPQTSYIGPLIKALTFSNLPAGTHVMTMNLTPEQQFDWAATLDYQSTLSGGFYSIQMTKPDGSSTGLDAGFVLGTPGSGAWLNKTTGRSEDVVSLGLVAGDFRFDEVLPNVALFIGIFGFPVAGAPEPITLSSLSLSTPTIEGGGTLSAAVTMSGVATEDTTVTIRASSLYTQGPTTLVIPAGASSASFPITTVKVTDNPRWISIQATYAGKTVQQFLTVTPGPVPPGTPLLASFQLSTNSVKGGTNLRGTVTLTLNALQDTVVTITNTSNGFLAQTPATVTIPAGTKTISFPITTSRVNTNQSVVIQTVYAGKAIPQTLSVTRTR